MSSGPSSATGHDQADPEKKSDLGLRKEPSSEANIGDLEKYASGEVKDAPKLVYVPFLGRQPPRDPYPSLNEAPIIPLATAGVFSRWTFWWIQPLLITGYQRTLSPEDLWKLSPDRECGVLADQLMDNFNRRKLSVENWNRSLESQTFKPSSLRKSWWKVKQTVFGVGTGDGKRKVGLALAISDTFFYTFWSGGAIKVIGDTAQVTSPLVTKALIVFGTSAYYAHSGVPGYTNPNIGVGVGLAIGLWLMQIVASICTNQFFVRGAGTGVLVRGALIAAIYRKALKLSGKARTVVTNGKLTNHISTDVSRIDFCCGFFHMTWTAPIQLIIIIIILLLNLGVSCLAGIAFLVVTLPGQSIAMKKMFALRRAAMVFTDKRAKLIQELLGGMKIIKFFAWEEPYAEKVDEIRRKELGHVRSLLIIRAANTAVAMSVPTLATVLAFVTYSLLGNDQNPTIIFTSLTLFSLIRMPLLMLPMSLSTCTDAYNALGRLTEVFLAEERSGSYNLDLDSKYAIQVTDGDFIWEGTPPDEPVQSKKQKAGINAALKAAAKKASKEAYPDASPSGSNSTPPEDQPLHLTNINLAIPKGQLTAIVGPVGSGKSSLLQALVGEMKRSRGSVTFGGSISYASQQPWIQNLSLRENILFGRPYDEARYNQAIQDACLGQDLEMLPFGDQTEIGEKGITLSGGQKQRVNIARCLYYDADIVLLDDPLSAVDAHVGKHLFEEAILGSLRGRTRILVTHALHFLPSTDWIICLDGGKITQQGTYSDLVAETDGAFSLLVKEFGGGVEEKKEEDEEKALETVEDAPADKAAPPKKASPQMQEEERATGSVSRAVYGKFFKAAKGHVTLPLLFLALVFVQSAQVLGSYWLVWWSEDQFRETQAFYLGLYAMFGILQAFFSFTMGLAGVFVGYNASKSLHKGAIAGIFRAPMSFFDQTPIGRAMNRFSKDVDTVDNVLNDSMRMFAATMATVLGSVILIGVVEPYFLIAFVFVIGLYWTAAQFYRTSAREIKRCDNLLRSTLYAHFAESLSGLATIRAYGESEKFLETNEKFINIENRAYYLTVHNQRWLGVRLDFFGGVLTFVVAIVGVASRYTISPSQIGLILSFVLSMSQSFTWAVRQGAEVENDLNSVERLLHYADDLEREAPPIAAFRPPKAWPASGDVVFKNVFMSYRPNLPPVLRGLSLDIRGGERIGIVGRTGAGKSSIMMALFRIVELSSGSIEVDGVDIGKIGLADLREKIAIIPQDALLFNGTLRSNLDPFGRFDDATLYSALKQSFLVDQVDGSSRFSLDLAIEDEGNNLSAGERSLVSLARALVKDSKIIVLDEATASVDYSTDSKIQSTIRSEFKNKTLLCIAHRLRTIINYDRVLVMEAGQVAEFDTPLALFHQDGIFRSMCDRSGITEHDLQSSVF